MILKQKVIPAEQMLSTSPYEIPRSKFPIKLQLDLNEGPVVDLDWNDVACTGFNRYPNKIEIEEMIAKRYRVESEQVLVTAGGDDAIDRICRAFLSPGDNLLFPEPSFEMIRNFAQMNGAEVRGVEWSGKFPVDEIVANSDANSNLVSVVSPNNPTGKTVSQDELQNLASRLPKSILLVDQAYAEFEDEGQSLTQFALEKLSNAVVVRTFSKAYGLAGMRIGFAIGTKSIIEKLRKCSGPFPVSSYSLSIVKAVLDCERDPTSKYVKRVQKERRELVELLAGFGCDCKCSQGNFVYVKFKQSDFDARFVFRALQASGILVRFFAKQNALRITCPGNFDDFELLSNTLVNIFRPEAILFDMDGVLVDESHSYREAIRLTCLEFGCVVEASEIARKKLNGNANNDWEFTHCVLKEKGIESDFETVKRRFERIYQGTEQRPGLWEREVRLVQAEWLRGLSKRFRLGIVTGRPRSDAIRFLQNEGLKDFFSTIVCMEDGPAKPEPNNVTAALQNLGVRKAWMIGDTPDDINAARSAGITSIGIVAPTDNKKHSSQQLLNSGAAKVVESLNQLGELLR